MLVLMVSNRKEKKLDQREWLTGKDFPMAYQDIYLVEEVIADGGELQMLVEHVIGIPKSKLPCQRWFGDDARFIASHFHFQSTLMGINTK